MTVDKKILAKLPKYAQAWNWIQLQNVYGTKIDAMCEPLPEDDWQEEAVCFTVDGISELLYGIREYKKNFSRQGYNW